MNIQERIEALETEFAEKIKALKAEVQQDQGFPRDGENYWYVDNDGVVMEMEWQGNEYDQGRLSIDNVFQTKEQAEFAVEKLKVEAELRKFSRPFHWGGENWILSMGTNKDIFLVYEDDEMNQGAVYFEDEYKALEAIEAVGKERIRKYIFGVED